MALTRVYTESSRPASIAQQDSLSNKHKERWPLKHWMLIFYYVPIGKKKGIMGWRMKTANCGMLRQKLVSKHKFCFLRNSERTWQETQQWARHSQQYAPRWKLEVRPFCITSSSDSLPQAQLINVKAGFELDPRVNGSLPLLGGGVWFYVEVSIKGWR